jgi:ketosteroid isomerase-like protein
MMRMIAAILAAALSPSPAPAGDTASFDAALEAHFDAIQSRDLDAFEATVTHESEMTLIFPDGEILTTREAVIDLHREWFADRSWTWEPEIIATTVGSDLAYALLRYTYTDDAAPRQNWLSLVFRLEDDVWRLVRDQNTPALPSSQ